MTLFLNFDAATMCILMACQGETEFKTKPHVRLTCLALLSLSLVILPMTLCALPQLTDMPGPSMVKGPTTIIIIISSSSNTKNLEQKEEQVKLPVNMLCRSRNTCFPCFRVAFYKCKGYYGVS